MLTLVNRGLVRSCHPFNFLRHSEERRRSEKLGHPYRSSELFKIVAELLDVVCEDLAHVSVDVRVRNNAKAIDHLSVWRHGVSEKGIQPFSRTLFEMSKSVHMPCRIKRCAETCPRVIESIDNATAASGGKIRFPFVSLLFCPVFEYL